jgi:hypothetical protein
MTADELETEIREVFAAGPGGPGFCPDKYVGLASCHRKANHDGDHVTVGRTGRLVAF